MSKDLKKLMAERSPVVRIQVKPEKLITIASEDVLNGRFVHKTTSGQTHKTEKLQVVKYTTHIPPELIKVIKIFAIEKGKKDYEVVQIALEEYLSKRK